MIEHIVKTRLKLILKETGICGICGDAATLEYFDEDFGKKICGKCGESIMDVELLMTQNDWDIQQKRD